jgi:hypothetical protein
VSTHAIARNTAAGKPWKVTSPEKPEPVGAGEFASEKYWMVIRLDDAMTEKLLSTPQKVPAKTH